jgi:hypothetical protein
MRHAMAPHPSSLMTNGDPRVDRAISGARIALFYRPWRATQQLRQGAGIDASGRDRGAHRHP